MFECLRRARLLAVLAGSVLLGLGTASCTHSNSVKTAAVKNDFGTFRTALLQGNVHQVITYVPQNVSTYLMTINSTGAVPPSPETPAAPSVDLLLRTALARKVAPQLRAHLTLQDLLQRLSGQGLLNCREIRDLSIGRVYVKGERASADVYFQGKPLPFRLPFIREDRVWKVDLLLLLPYAEILMRLDRALTGKTETQQVARLVEPLPSL